MTDARQQPRPYHQPVSVWWWLAKRSYFVFAMRELSGIFIAWFVVFLLMLIVAVGQGAEEYQSFMDWAATPWVVALNLVTLVFVVLHTITWFNLTPQAMVVKMGGQRLPAWVIIGSQYVGLLAVSALVYWLVTR
jgi:fumarate reductase subunit C